MCPARIGVTIVIAALAVAAAPVHSASATTCSPTLQHRGATYDGLAAPFDLPPRVGRPATAYVPDCAGPMQTPHPPSPLTVHRLRGIHPAVAVIDREDFLYLAEGFFPQLPSHPLHRSLYGYRPTLQRQCARRRFIAGVVSRPPNLPLGMFLRVANASAEVQVLVDRHTRVHDLRRLGLPYLGRGRRVRVYGARCAGETRGPVARDIWPAARPANAGR